MRVVALAAALVLAAGAAAHAQPPQVPAGLIAVERSDETSTIEFANRAIVTLRATVSGRLPPERAKGAERILEDLAEQGVRGPVAVQALGESTLVTVAGRGVFAITPQDLDELSGETLQGVSAQAVDHLSVALNEAEDARTPRVLLEAAALATAGILAGLVLLWALRRAHRVAANRLLAIAQRTLAKTGLTGVQAVKESRLVEFESWVLTTAAVTIGLVICYATLTFVLRRFPYTRPWGESMSAFLLANIEHLGSQALDAIPGLLTVVMILVVTRVLTRVVSIWFRAVEQERVRPRWIYPDTAIPTRRIIVTLLWLFAVVVAYPYMPGSETEAFKGVTVFLGLMVTFGSSGLVNQVMSGFMITYSRALGVGHFVKIGDVEGTVTHLGVLSTKLTSLWNEDVTVPNTVVVGTTMTNYSRFGDRDGMFTQVSVTIGYDAPWRQVHAMLLRAAERTPGLRRDPKPLVIQASLDDFYVRYTLLVCLERQQSRPYTLNVLHANIQDQFNEHGVQIMSPNYMLDPAAPKVVPKKDWFAEPAARDRSAGPEAQV